MAKIFDLTLITPDKTLYEGRVESLVAPAALGYLGVLANHAPLVASLTEGKIIIRPQAGESIIFYSKGKGFLQVLKNKVIMILDSAAANQ